jgi:glycosyltransferase involved in cell wall biosynthesis
VKVVLDALWLDPGRSGGPETYLRGLAPALARGFPSLDLHVATTRRGFDALSAEGWGDFAALHRFAADEGERGRRLAAEQLGLPARAGRALVHGLVTGPVRTRGPLVQTVHDATFLRVPTFSRVTTVAMRTIIGGAARHADALLTASEAAADECAEAFGLDRDAFLVVPHGAGRLPDVAPAPIDRLAIPDAARVALTVAAIRPHKNQELLVRALDHLPDDVHLVLAGAQEPYADRLRGHPRVHLPGYVTDAELEGLWRRADAAAFPTLGEGFGLPVLEAMQRDVPVACSDIRVLREVGGDVPAYFDPHDPAAAAAAVERALGGQSGGPERAALFTWERSAAGTHEAYERAAYAARRTR